MWISAPCLIIDLTTSTFPPLAALCNGVSPNYIKKNKLNNAVKLAIYQLAIMLIL